jgi:hypothetical protein
LVNGISAAMEQNPTNPPLTCGDVVLRAGVGRLCAPGIGAKCWIAGQRGVEPLEGGVLGLGLLDGLGAALELLVLGEGKDAERSVPLTPFRRPPQFLDQLQRGASRTDLVPRDRARTSVPRTVHLLLQRAEGGGVFLVQDRKHGIAATHRLTLTHLPAGVVIRGQAEDRRAARPELLQPVAHDAVLISVGGSGNLQERDGPSPFLYSSRASRAMDV